MKALEAARDQIFTRARKDPFFVAHALDGYQQSRDWTDAELCDWLDIDAKALWRLGLCRHPSDEHPDFLQSVQNISDYAGCSQERLLQVLRESAAIETLRQTDNVGLMAARDRQLEDDEEANEEDPRDSGGGN